MTVNSTTNRVSYARNGTTSPMGVNFPFQAQSDLRVVETVIATGAQTDLTLNSNYTITGTTDTSGFYPNGGNVVPSAANDNPVIWTIYRDPPITQTVQHVDNDPLPAASIDNPLDKLTMIAQRHKDRLDRALTAPDGDQGATMVLPPAAARANGNLGFDAAGRPTITVPGAQAPTGNVFRLSQYATLPLADAAALAGNGVLLIDSTYTLIANTALVAKSIRVEGGKVVTAGFTLTLPSGFTAPAAPWVDRTGGGHVDAYNCNCIGYPEWYVGYAADVVGTLGANGFSITSGTDVTSYIQEIIDYGPRDIHFSANGLARITQIVENGSRPHHYYMPPASLGTVGFVGSGAASPYLAQVTNTSALEKQSGAKFVIVPGLAGTDGGYSTTWTNLNCVTTDFDHVVPMGRLWGGDTLGVNRTIPYCRLISPRLRGWVGLHISQSDKIYIQDPDISGKLYGLNVEATQDGTYTAVHKVIVISGAISQLQNTSGAIVRIHNYTTGPNAVYVQGIKFLGTSLEYGYRGIWNGESSARGARALGGWVHMEQISDTSRQLVDNGSQTSFIVDLFNDGDAGVIASIAGDGGYWVGNAHYAGANGFYAASGGFGLLWKNGYLGANYTGADSHRLKRAGSSSEGDVILDVGSNTNDTVFYVMSGGAGNVAASGLNMQKNSITLRSINAGGTVNAGGADMAEYRLLCPRLQVAGSVAKGALLGVTANGEYTDRWSEVSGRIFIKTTDPHVVGNDRWGTEESICAKYGVAPVNTLHWADDLDEIENPEEYQAEKIAMLARKSAFEAAHEAERIRWDRVAISGLVPCNVAATTDDVGKYLVPVQGAGDGIGAVLKSLSELDLAEYVKSFGVIERIGEDGRPLVNVKVA